MIRLLNGDCLEKMSEIESGSVDMVVTDPPYGMEFVSNRAKNGPRHKAIANDDVFFTEWLGEAYRVLKDGGGLISFCDWNTSHVWRQSIEQYGYDLKSQAIWNRMHHGMGDLTGSFAPMHDIIWYATKGKRTFANKRPKSVFSHRRPSPSEDHGHPTCKPVSLMQELIHGIGDGSDGIVLDPFMGSGSTGVAAQRLGLPFIGIELDDKYFKIASERLQGNNGLSSFFS